MLRDSTMLQIDDLKWVPIAERSKAAVVHDIAEVRAYIPAMIGWLRRQAFVDYLTGPEVSLFKRVIVTNVEGDYSRIFINPVVIGYGDLIKEKRHEHVSVHALNLKNEQFLVNTENGYYKGREDIGKVMAVALQDAYTILDISS